VTDLVERLLRAWGVGQRNGYAVGLMKEAADTIEAQAGELERLKAEVGRLTDGAINGLIEVCDLRAEVERLRKDAARWQFFRNSRTDPEVLEEAIDAAMEKP